MARPPKPGGREAVLAAIAALPASRQDKPQDSVKIWSDFKNGAFGIVVQAAKVRRISLASYMRRATLAMACRDLEIPLSEALIRDPRIARDTGTPIPDPEGVKFGPWEIEKLVGEPDEQ
jgi:hypothetical protein